ncbi:MAG: DUF2169 domain-containing protein [Polyangiaceae bacterium]|nr:DUF2169 domain-containing protein [Polyangiaceae bacterium]
METASIGPIATGTGLFRYGGALRVMIVAKACFRLVQGGPMTLDSPPEIRVAEAHHADNPARSIRAASDLAPFLERADVLFIGAAYPPGGAPLPAMSVRLAVARGGYAILDKVLVIYGDRSPSGGEPKPFTRMPLVYEKAFGGIGLGDNPLGTATPNIVHADPARQKEPAGYGPISWYWPSRKRLLRGHPRQALEQRIVEIPDGFDVSFFQAAPEDQRIPFLIGDEALLLQGLHPTHASLETRLPGVRAAARVYTKTGMGRPFPLVADTLFIDGDADQCSITWRGSFPVTSEEALADLCVAAALEIGGAPIEWPDRPPVRRVETAPQRGRPMPAVSAETVAISGEETTIRRPSSHITPFAAGARPSAPPPPRMPAAPSAPQDANPLEGTLALDEGSFFDTEKRPGFDDSTIAVGDAGDRRLGEMAAPFQIAASGTAKTAPTAPIPGAPWAGSAPTPSPKPSFKDTTLTLSDADKEPPAAKADAPAPPPPPKEAPPPPPAPEKQAEPNKNDKNQKPAWSWAPQPEAPPPAPAPAKKAAPPPPPKPAVKSKIYGSFGEPKKK